jgi:hypothetical protein
MPLLSPQQETVRLLAEILKALREIQKTLAEKAK